MRHTFLRAQQSLRNILLGGGVLVGVLWSLASSAATHTVDDSGSQVLSPQVAMRWDQPVPHPSQINNLVRGQFTVLLRLNTSQWQGQSGRLYLVVPTPPTGPVRVAWRSKGMLVDGEMLSGTRTVVFSGSLPGPVVQDTLQMVVVADGSTLVNTQRLDFTFEWDDQQ